MTIRLSLITYVGFFFCMNVLHGQIEVTSGQEPPYTPQNLIENVFLGSGVEVLSITHDGDPSSVGFFSNAENDIGIERGLVMSTGRVINLPGPGSVFSSTDLGISINDNDVNAISTNMVRTDISRYIITFIPTADTLRFRYVFGSEEYPEFVCDQYNDVFGFFISGPGINGPYENNAINIATIPGTSTPVAINNVNNGNPNNPGCIPQNAQYYIDNQNGPNLTLDAFIRVFTAEVEVEPCEEYTIKLVISDIGDGLYDSGVFLEAKSFGTGSLKVQTTTVSLDGTITEGCASATLSFVLPSRVETDYLLDYSIFGNAQPGVDYLTIPPDLYIPAGDSIVSFVIDAYEDNIPEGLDTIFIDVQTNICNRDTFFFYIRENDIEPPDLGDDLSICTGDTIDLNGTLPIPEPVPPIFTNNNDVSIPTGVAGFSPVNVTGVQPFVLGPNVIKQICIDSISHQWISDIDMYLISPDGQFLELSTDNGADGGNGPGLDYYLNTCFTEDATMSIDEAGPGSVPYTGEWLPEGVWSDLWDSDHPTNGLWQLHVSDDQPGFNGTVHSWTICFKPSYELNYVWESDPFLTCYDCPESGAFPTDETTYVLHVTDSYGCEVTDSITISVNSALPPPDIDCFDQTDTSITVNWQAINGASGYQVSTDGINWTTVPSTTLEHTVTGLTLNDSATVYIRGLSGCNGQIDSILCYTSTCQSYTHNVDNLQHITCNGDEDGSVTLSVNGNNGPYTYELDGEVSTTGVFTNLGAGVYSFTVLDQSNCPLVDSITIQEPDALVGTAILVDTVTCFGGNDGAATIEVSGGLGTYSFLWDNASTDSIATNLSAGLATITVTDDNMCTFEVNLQIPEYPELNSVTNGNMPTCFGGSDGQVSAVPNGGAGGYTIVWTPQVSGSFDQFTYSDIPAGNYDYVLTDRNFCTIMGTIPLSQPAALTTTITGDSVSCFGGSDGSATVVVQGGTGNITYLWNDALAQITPTASNLIAGTYIVQISDENMCTATDTITIFEPAEITFAIDSMDVSCFGGNDGWASITPSGGSGSFTFDWASGQSTASITNLVANDYIVTVRDENNCTFVKTFHITEPGEIVVTESITDVGCNNNFSGAIQITPGGGSPPYQFNWIGPGNFNENSQDIFSLASGDYFLTVTDANLCTATFEYFVNQALALTSAGSQTPVTCFGNNDGSASVNVSGGNPPYQYLWQYDQSTGTVLDNIPAGTYLVGISDNTGCALIDTIEVLGPEQPVSSIVDAQDVLCYGDRTGRIIFETIGGTPPYTYSIDGNLFSPSEEWYNLEAGIYQVTTMDSEGCTDTATVTIIEPPELMIDLGGSILLNYGETTTLSVEIENAVFPVTYLWSEDSLGYLSCYDCPEPCSYYF